MEFWNESPLNKAHFYERKAARLLKSFSFDGAIECHSAAAGLLTKALEQTSNRAAEESIQLQHAYHMKQKDFLKVKKLQYLAILEGLRVKKEAMSRMIKACEGEKQSGQDNDGASLQRAIYRTIEETDSLLELLVNRNDDATITTEELAESVKLGSKRPKDENTVIEELRIANFQLRSLVSELMSQLAASEAEVSVLRQRVSQLEAQSAEMAPSQDRSAYSSPCILSPSDCLSPEGHQQSELPALAPLAMPPFDLSVLHKKYH